jgi:hypothetical protein
MSATGLQGSDRAGLGRRSERNANLPSDRFLVRFRPPDRYDCTVGGECDIAGVQGDKLGPAERPGETQQQECAVADAERAVRKAPDHHPQGFGQHQRLPGLGRALAARMPFQTSDTAACLIAQSES